MEHRGGRMEADRSTNRSLRSLSTLANSSHISSGWPLCVLWTLILWSLLSGTIIMLVKARLWFSKFSIHDRFISGFGLRLL
jgi:hypothetical protein